MVDTKLFGVKSKNIKIGDMVEVNPNGMLEKFSPEFYRETHSMYQRPTQIQNQYLQYLASKYGEDSKEYNEALKSCWADNTINPKYRPEYHPQQYPPEPNGFKCNYCGSLFKDNPDKCPNCGGSEIRRRDG